MSKQSDEHPAGREYGRPSSLTAPLTVDEILRLPHFESLPASEADWLLNRLEIRTYAPREAFFRVGDKCKGYYVVRKGRARIYRAAPDGREITVRLLAPGDSFGEVPVFDNEPYPAGVEAIEVTEAVFVGTPVFAELLGRNPTVALAILKHFARRLRSFTELVDQISLQTVQQRIARYLYFAAREQGTDSPEGVVVPRTITQQDLAALVGSVREVVTRVLKAMEQDGIVVVRRKDFVVPNIEALRQLL